MASHEAQRGHEPQAAGQPATFVPDPAEEERCAQARRILGAWVRAGILPGPAPITREGGR